MELRDCIMKFPPYWRGIFAPLSKNHHAVMGADSWLLENREGALTCPGISRSCHGSQIDWMGFVDGLCEEEPAEIRSRLVFLPRILLFPVNIQRNTLAFLSEHLAEIPTKCLVNLLESLGNHQPFPDEWVRHHLRTMQDFVCMKCCQNYGSGFRADDHRSKLTKASWDGFSNVCRLIRDKDGTRDGGDEHKLQFDWLPEAFSTNQRACQHGTYFASEMIASPVQRKSSPETLQNNHVEETKKTPESPSKKQKTDVSSPSEIIVITESLPSSPMQVCPVTEEKVAGISEIGRNGAEASVGGQTASIEVASGGQEDAKEGVAGDGASDEDGLKDSRSDVIDAVTMVRLNA